MPDFKKCYRERVRERDVVANDPGDFAMSFESL
jgi:hypothetical protein